MPETAEKKPFSNEWGHTAEDYAEVLSGLSSEILSIDFSQSPIYRYLQRQITSMLLVSGHPDPMNPSELFYFARATAIALLAHASMEGYITFTEKAMRAIVGEEVEDEGDEGDDPFGPGDFNPGGYV